jgi:hypothetical protein
LYVEYILNLLTQNELTTLIMIKSVGYYLNDLVLYNFFTKDINLNNITFINRFGLSLRI